MSIFNPCSIKLAKWKSSISYFPYQAYCLMRFRSGFGVGSKNCGRGSEITKKKKKKQERERGGRHFLCKMYDWIN